MQYHLFADDTQMYVQCTIQDIPVSINRLTICIDELSQSYASHRLQLNASKTEFIWFGSRATLARIPAPYRSLSVGSSVVLSCNVVRDLGVLLDSELSMKQHVNKVASICYYHLRRLRQLRCVVSQATMAQLVTSLVLSRLDYCNSVLVNLPASTTAPLQRVQNAAARLVLGLDRREHITPALKQLHWLPINYRIKFKIATLVHNVLHGRCPPYLSDLINFAAADAGRRGLRSSSSGAAVLQRTRTKFGNRAFSVSGPAIWNSLPPSLRLIDSHSSFRRQLKTHLFSLAFD